MLYRHLEPVSKQLTIVIGLTVVGFMAFGLALSLYRNVLFEQTLEQMSAQNDALRMENVRARQDLEYYRSVSYRDKYAKENLGRINPGEKLIVIEAEIPHLEAIIDPDKAAAERQAAYEELLGQMPVLEQWRLYLFNQDRLIELQRSIPLHSNKSPLL